jgi:hypothetical protein
MSRLFLLVAAATLAAACAVIAPSGVRAATACGANPYSYAGVLSKTRHFGVGATITPLGVPALRAGHVAAWVGVGGEGLGPNGSTEWLQAGISVEHDRGIALYYELALPGQDPRYVMLKGHLRLDRSYRIAVLESKRKPGSWHVWVNGTALTKAIRLPGSHGAWRPVATTESWNGDVGACNGFAFRFSNVAVAGKPGGSWSPIKANVLSSPGFRVAGQKGLASFVAAGGPASERVTAGN